MQSAEIIAIGTELTSGAKLDTNSQWLSLQLADLGIVVQWHTTVADELAANVDAIRIASRRVDLVLISGGLGPTLDDLTREAMAAAAGVELVLDEASLVHVEGFFRSRGREMPARNRIQAMLPRGASALGNPIGTAPGVWMELPREGRPPCVVAAMPGVPSEMFRMFHEQVRPRLPGGAKIIRRARINCFGIGESHTEELLGTLTARGLDPEIGITAHEATITLRIIAQGSSERECQQKIDIAAAQIRERVGPHVYGVEDEELEDVVIRLLAERGFRLVTYEDATDGQLAERLAVAQRRWQLEQTARQRPLVPPPFRRGVISSLAQEQVDDPQDVKLSVSELSVEQSPTGHRLSWVTIRLEIPGRDVIEVRLSWSGNPAIFRSRTSKSALDILRRSLENLDLSIYFGK